VAVASRRHRVLVVDDEAGIRLLLDRALTRAGFEVRAVGSLEEAIAELYDADGIVTDYHLGNGVTGTDVVLAAQARLGRTAPAAILVTATPDDVPDDERTRFVEVLAKPFRLPTLIDAVRVMLADRRPRTRSSVEPRPIEAWLAERDGTED
jgi:DNA-binding NtrC family response regulator